METKKVDLVIELKEGIDTLNEFINISKENNKDWKWRGRTSLRFDNVLRDLNPENLKRFFSLAEEIKKEYENKLNEM